MPRKPRQRRVAVRTAQRLAEGAEHIVIVGSRPCVAWGVLNGFLRHGQRRCDYRGRPRRRRGRAPPAPARPAPNAHRRRRHARCG